MSCDIHTLVQVKRDGVWETVASEVGADQNYTVFAILAGVKKSYAENLTAISEPRGLPLEFNGAEDYYFPDGTCYRMGYHSHSWVTLEELKEYASKNKKVMRSGFVCEYDYIMLKGYGIEPESWSREISGDRVRTILESEYEPLSVKERREFRAGYMVYIKTSWYSDIYGLSDLIEVLESYSKGLEARFVFGFDN